MSLGELRPFLLRHSQHPSPLQCPTNGLDRDTSQEGFLEGSMDLSGSIGLAGLNQAGSMADVGRGEE